MSTETASGVTDEERIWVEKYRPDEISEVVGQDDITHRLQGYVDENEIPNLLFSGGAGIGKTTSAVALAKEIYGDEWKEHFLELNASDDRGIDVVRDRIKSFARSSFGNVEHRIIFLDESDSLTSDAQSALRRTIEKFSDNVRFILSCNYPGQIIDPIQSRCSVMKFSPISDEDIKQHLQTIADNEDIKVTDDGLEAIAYTANGDMRRAVNALQGTGVSGEVVDEDVVYRVTSVPRPEEIKEMVELAINDEFHEARLALDDLLTEKGLSGTGILSQIHRLVWDFNIDDDAAVEIMNSVGEADYRITEGADDRIQLESLLADITKEI